MSRNRRQYHYLIKNTTRKRRKPRTIKPLPIPEEHKCDDSRGLFHYFSITQEETADVFTVSVENRYNSLFEILVGGDNLHGCIIINISRIDYQNPDSPWEAFLNVEYTEYQNIINDASKGARTVALMHTAISFVFTHFNIAQFILKDISVFICAPQPARYSPIFNIVDKKFVSVIPENTYEIFLPALYILKYGHSWYKKHFNAQFDNRKMRSRIAQYKLFIHHKQDWNYLFDTYISHDLRILEDDKEREKIQTALYDAWSRTETYRDFILDVISDDNHCYYLLNWFDRIFNDMVCSGYFTDVDNYIVYEEFEIIKGMKVSYIKTTYGKGRNVPAIETLHKNEELTTILGGGGENVLFKKILRRRPNPRS